MTTSNSISVKPFRFIMDQSFHQPKMSRGLCRPPFSTAPVFLDY
jgi:hypothetical protein